MSKSEAGLVQVILLFLLFVGIGGSVLLTQKQQIFKSLAKNDQTSITQRSIQTPNPSVAIKNESISAYQRILMRLSQPKQTSSPTDSPNKTTQIFSPLPSSSPTPSPIPHNITVTGFTYEDRNDNGIFDSDDPKLPNMYLTYQDSLSNMNQPYGYWSDPNGNIYISLDVVGNLVVKPQAYNNFIPKSTKAEYSSSTQDVRFGFRSASAPATTQFGIIEGNIFQDSNHNQTKDSGEESIYFYKLYLIDDKGNYYNTIENAQATDESGHFKYTNLPADRSYTIRLSNPTGQYTINQTEFNFTLSYTHPEDKDIQIPVYRNY